VWLEATQYQLLMSQKPTKMAYLNTNILKKTEQFFKLKYNQEI